MEIIKRYIIGSNINLNKKNTIWNIIGSVIFAFSSMVLTIAVTRISSEVLSGYFFFGLSNIGQQMLNISYLGTRPKHVTDSKKLYTFGEYLFLRIIGCILAIVSGLLYLLITKSSFNEFVIIFLMIVYKIIDGLADVYECEFQRGGRLYLTGKSNTFRTSISIIAFLFVLITTQNLLIACFIINIFAIIGFYIFNIKVLKALPKINYKIEMNDCKKLFILCFPLFVGSFLELFIFSASRYAVRANIKQLYTHFSSIFILTSVINLVATFIIRPYLSILSLKYSMKDFKTYKIIVLKICCIIFALGFVAVILAYSIGTQILGYIYGLNLILYKASLVYIIIGGTFNAITTLLYYALVIKNKQNSTLIAYILVFFLSLFICTPLVKLYGLNGAGLAHMILMIAVAAICAFFYIINQNN